MNSSFIILTALECLMYIAHAQNDTAPGLRQEQDSQAARMIYGMADVNGNGQVTLPELHRIFQAFDANSNGNVTNGEFTYKWTVDQLGPFEQGQQLFENLDFNQDGVIDESNDVIGFYHFDTNGDNYITEDEFVVGWLWYPQ